MGVLGDDDIEKLDKVFQQRRYHKIFHDPKKASNLFGIMLNVVIVLSLVTGLSVFLVASIWDAASEWSDSFDGLQDITVKNSDCNSLKSIALELRHSDVGLAGTEQLIKDEIQFRC